MLTYTLSAITGCWGFPRFGFRAARSPATSRNARSRCVATKPIARWQIWLGKWLGIASLNASLLALAGGCIYGLLEWRATKLPADGTD